MNYSELIEALRFCANVGDCDRCKRRGSNCEDKLLLASAKAIEELTDTTKARQTALEERARQLAGERRIEKMVLIDRNAMMKDWQEKICWGVRCAECPLRDEDGRCKIERYFEEQPIVYVVKHGELKAYVIQCLMEEDADVRT